MRPVTVPIKKIGLRELKLKAQKYWEKFDRPRTRADCVDVPRPCPFVGCRYNLYLDVNQDTGSIRFNFPGLIPSEMRHSCALDLAAQGGMTLDNVGNTLNITRERIRQVEAGMMEVLGADQELAKLNVPEGERN